MEHLIELKDVYTIYHMGDEDVHALDGVSLTIDQGEFVAIVGQSGSGKSTAMNIIGCLDVPTSGTYHLGGIDVSTMGDDQQAEIRNRMLGFLQKLNREGDTVVLITHDNSIAVKARRIVRLQDGRIIYDGDAGDPRAVVQPEACGEEAGA